MQATTEQLAQTLVPLPRLNSYVPGKGIFRGLIPDPAGGPDRKLYEQVGALSDGAKWDVCMQAAADCRDEGQADWRLPTRSEAAQLYAVARDDHDGWYWTSEQSASNPGYAWVQDFYYGYQTAYWEGNDDRARAVRSEPIQ